MADKNGTLKVCSKGHSFYKSSDCPTCPACEAARKPDSGFLAELSAPARRALEGKGITTLAKLARFSEDAILELHGMGPSSVPKLRRALEARQLSFKPVASKAHSQAARQSPKARRRP